MPHKINFIKNNKGLFHIFVHVPAGSIYEPDNVRGISHLLEHMLLKHTKKYTEKKLLSEITSLGGNYNAVTDRDVTFYYIMTHVDNYRKCVDIMHSVMVEPVFTEYELIMERKVVIEELKRREDSDSDLYNLSYLTILSPNNKYAMPVEGYEKTLMNVTVKDLTEYHKKHYRDYMVFVNCDYKSFTAAEKYVNEKFGANKTIELNEISIMHGSMGYQSSMFVLHRSYKQYSMNMMFPSYPRSMTRENTILNFIKYCLVSAGLYSILAYQLRARRGLIYSISAMNETYRFIGTFRINVSTSTPNTEYIIGLIIESLLKVRKYGFPPNILKYFRKGFINEQKYALTNDDFRSILYSEGLFYGVEPNEDEYIDMINGITNEDIKTVASNVFDLEKMGILTFGNYKNESAVRKQIAEVVNTYNIISE